jgi:hypothetical protein
MSHCETVTPSAVALAAICAASARVQYARKTRRRRRSSGIGGRPRVPIAAKDITGLRFVLDKGFLRPLLLSIRRAAERAEQAIG